MASGRRGLSNEEKLELVTVPNFNDLPRTRTRDLGRQFLVSSDQEFTRTFGTSGPWNGLGINLHTLTIPGTQKTVSEGHPFRFSKAKGRSDIGGNFFTQKTYVSEAEFRKLSVITDNGPQDVRIDYSGPVLAVNPTSPPVSMSSQISSNSQLDALGTTAISRVKPTNPVGGLTTALIELRKEGLPHLLGSSLWEGKTSVLRSIGEENLNYQFGYVPLANDISNFLGTVTQANDVINHYRDGIGKPTRRRYDFTPFRSYEKVSLGATNPYLNIENGNGIYLLGPWRSSVKGQLTLEKRVFQERWFSGSFTYYFPHNARGKLGEFAILAHELGLDLSPETIWNAAPWSWAVDWFSNAGDVISNYSSFHNDGLVMTYGYMMEHTIVEHTYKHEGHVTSDGKPLRVGDVTFVIETKQRRQATPYGFGLSFGALSGFQKAILGSLGLTRIFR